jgi:hypothetical protein
VTAPAELGRLDVERRIMTEDRGLKFTQLAAEFEAELLEQLVARVAIRLEGLRLPPGTVKGKHELTTEPLAQGMLVDLSLELGNELGMAPESKVGLDPGLDGDQTEFVKARDLTLCELLVRNVDKGGTAPKRESGAQRVGRGARIAGELGSTALDEGLEPDRINRLRAHGERVSTRACRKGIAAECAP